MKAEKTSFNIFNGVGKNYINGDLNGEKFYEYPLYAKGSFDSRKTDVYEQYNCDRERLVEILKIRNKKLGASNSTLNEIDKLADTRCLAVVTGQQAGFMTGPMYTIYKAVTAIKLARKQEKVLGVPVVPVFWIASEDHDFEEVANTYIATNKLERLSIKRPSHIKSSIGKIEINDNIKEVSQWFLGHFKNEIFYNDLVSIVDSSLETSENLAEYFSKIMTKLFENQGLIIIDPMWSEVRCLQKSFIKDAIKNRVVINDIFNKTTENLEAEGFKKQITLMKNGINLFREVNGSRQRLEFNAETNNIESFDGSFVKSLEGILDDVDKETGSYSMNVVMRPIGQDVLLPTLAYVAGPGEMNYYSQLKDVYSVFNKKMPIIYPRENFTVVESNTVELADKFNMELESLLLMKKNEMHNLILDKNDSFGIDSRFNEFYNKFDNIYDEMLKELKNEFNGIVEFEEKNKQLICYQVEYLRKKVKLQNRKRHKDLLCDANILLDHISPMEHLQERCFSYLMYYSKKGDQLIDWLINDIEIDINHRLIKI